MNNLENTYLSVAVFGLFLIAIGDPSAAEYSGQQLNQETCPQPKGRVDCTLDLLAGTASRGCYTPPLSVLSEPFDSNGDGWSEACIKVNLKPKPGYNRKNGILVTTKYQGTPSGWSFNVGDSLTNNGWGGDASTQSNDSEAQMLNDTLTVFANDNGPSNVVSQVSFPWLTNTKVCYEIRNQLISWSQSGSNLKGFSSTPNPTQMLFALAGQNDLEGPINYDVFICGNRVVDGGYFTSRLGKGLRRIQIQLVR